MGGVVLVEPSHPGNLGAVVRVAANFGVGRLELVRPLVPVEDPEVRARGRGGERHLRLGLWDDFSEATAGYRTLVGTASARARPGLPTIAPPELVHELGRRGLGDAALLFGNETSGLRRDHLDRCDLVVTIPTVPHFPVLNLAQAVAILLGYICIQGAPEIEPAPRPATQERVDGLMEHLASALLTIGFLDPQSPYRILRKLRRLFGRAAITDNEVAVLRGICRQMEWAARHPHSEPPGRSGSDSDGGQGY